MPQIITITDFNTHIYEEIIDAITRTDDTIVDAAIDAAIAEVKGYCSRFDRTKLFDPDDDDYVEDKFLQKICKDVACWHLIKLANPNVNMELFRAAYDDTIDWLVRLQKQQVDPEGWPLPADDADTDYIEGSSIQISSNTKRNNHY